MLNATKKPILLALLIVLGSIAGCLGNDEEKTESETLIIAFEIKDDYTNAEANPQLFADFMSEQTGLNVEIYPITSEGSIIEALRFGHADIAFMDAGAAWMGWQQYGLEVLAADTKSDGRAYYNAHAVVLNGSDAAEAYFTAEDPFAVLQGKTSCHTGWLKSAGMLLPMGFLISEGYAPVIGPVDDIESLRSTIYSYFSEDASIPDSGTPYSSYGGALRCLSDGTGDVAFVKDSSVATYCGSDDPAMNEEWCLALREYIHLPSYGQAPSHPVMFNPETLDVEKQALILEALLSLNNEQYLEDGVMGDAIVTGCVDLVENTVDEEIASSQCGDSILANILNTGGLIETDTESHLGIYGSLIESVPGISTYFGTKYGISS